MQFNSDRKRIDQTWVNVKKAKAIVKEFTSKNNGTQPTANNSASIKLLNDLYELFIFDDGVDEVTACGAQEFRDFVIQQLHT